MKTFEVTNEFLVDGVPTKLISGAVHYFRMTEKQWEDSLYNLKALGANAVETYIPWNIHEPQEGQFDFSGRHNVGKFIETAEQQGLMVILRPTPYICAEWEFGGLPAWLLNNPGIRLRTPDPIFIEKVGNYYRELMKVITPYQVTNGGPVIMMQIENEYGSFNEDKDYLRAIKKLMTDNGVNVPLFTSDGAWDACLEAGGLPEEGVIPTGNFGSRSKENADALRAYMKKHDVDYPVMCMEFWDGWFNRWGDEIIRRDPQELADEVAEMLRQGSANLYMFHGGTNFGFYNGCSARDDRDLPQVTSYDYDALLNEWGNPTEKYYAVQRAIAEVCPEVEQFEPRVKEMGAYGTVEVADQVSLFSVIEDIKEPVTTTYPLPMEKLGTGLGYAYYETSLTNYNAPQKSRIVEGRDRVQMYVNDELLLTQFQSEIGTGFEIPAIEGSEDLNVKLLFENQGRVNYGYKLNAPTQIKGLKAGLMYDLHFTTGYKQVAFDLNPTEIAKIDFAKAWAPNQPAFYKFDLDLTHETELKDSFIDCSNYGKGVIVVNGHNLGRYYEVGPIHYLYVPKEFLVAGHNEIVIFETEGVAIKELAFSKKPIYKQVNHEAHVDA
jgi:beta-galactosidase